MAPYDGEIFSVFALCSIVSLVPIGRDFYGFGGVGGGVSVSSGSPGRVA